MNDIVLLVMAKAPVPGLAKTRLCPPATPEQAAAIAAASLLDTIDAVRATPGVRPVLALTGDLDAACRAAEIRAALHGWAVLPQRGGTFPDRLANAHADAAGQALPVLQIGMDTPQVTPGLLAAASESLHAADSVFGPAEDGGWWAIGFRAPGAAGMLRQIPTSQTDTGRRTRNALCASGLTVADLPPLADADTMPEARRIAGLLPGSRFAAAVLR